MSRRDETVLIDGSNAVHALFGPMQGTRDADGWEADLVMLVADRVSGVAEIVFDGGWRPVGAGSGVRVLFSEGDSADAVILERVRALRYQKRKVTVVTRDRGLADAARSEEARIADPDVLNA